MYLVPRLNENAQDYDQLDNYEKIHFSLDEFNIANRFLFKGGYMG